MTTNQFDFKIFKKDLKNGLTVLVKPSGIIPRVDIQMWYNVGSKQEITNEKGMAHLIEHMIFKGTKKLSESDINLLTQKMAGQSNAFTTQDYTCYTFRLPSTVWHYALEIFADCMHNATFKQQMLFSEVKAVIEEFRMYSDDYYTTLVERLTGSIFQGHPYSYPIIGSKHDLASLDSEQLYQFYQKHYQPANATLVVVGDVDPEEVFTQAEKYFSHLKNTQPLTKFGHYFDADISSQSVTLYRPVKNPWSCFWYIIPGLASQQTYLFDVASLILANGKSSRLYQKLVVKHQLATDVESFVYDLFEHGIFCINVQPKNATDLPIIEEHINESIEKLLKGSIKDWEVEAAKKRALVDLSSLLENSEQQATLIGSTYLATQDPQFLNNYLANMSNIDIDKLQTTLKAYLRKTCQHQGYLFPLPNKNEEALFLTNQQAAEKLEDSILSSHQRTSNIEPGKWINEVPEATYPDFSYPKPTSTNLENGINLITHHNATVDQICVIFSLKTNHLYESPDKAGLCYFGMSVLTHRTAKLTPSKLHTLLETSGISLSSGVNSITFKCLSKDFEKALDLVQQMLCNPSFDQTTIDHVRHQLMVDVQNFWDSPSDFIDQLAREHIYKNHPYGNNPYGTIESIRSIKKHTLEQWYKTQISPQEAQLIITGNFDQDRINQTIERVFGRWHGPAVPDITYPPLTEHKPQVIEYPFARDQVVLGFVAPSLERSNKNFNALALLDVIVTGGPHACSSSRLFALREQSGLFYTINGSLVFDASQQQGMMFIKTIVSKTKIKLAEKMILQAINEVGQNGITDEEFLQAKNVLFNATVELFESNIQTARTFLFMKKNKLNFDLFDKLGHELSIIKLGQVNNLAKEFCNNMKLSVIRVGRS
ncbi:MAG: insulinase family protein [Epsilonproteobacteria bacterium]|nr:insulinase family protein [Campylobacterota bacterium]